MCKAKCLRPAPISAHLRSAESTALRNSPVYCRSTRQFYPRLHIVPRGYIRFLFILNKTWINSACGARNMDLSSSPKKYHLFQSKLEVYRVHHFSIWSQSRPRTDCWTQTNGSTRIRAESQSVLSIINFYHLSYQRHVISMPHLIPCCPYQSVHVGLRWNGTPLIEHVSRSLTFI